MTDIILEVIVPEAWAIKVLNSFIKITDTHMTITSIGSGDPETEFSGQWDFRIQPKDIAENNKEFGERVLRELGKAVVNMVNLTEDIKRYRTEISAINPASSDIPEDILQ